MLWDCNLNRTFLPHHYKYFTQISRVWTLKHYFCSFYLTYSATHTISDPWHIYTTYKTVPRTPLPRPPPSPNFLIYNPSFQYLNQTQPFTTLIYSASLHTHPTISYFNSYLNFHQPIFTPSPSNTLDVQNLCIQQRKPKLELLAFDGSEPIRWLFQAEQIFPYNFFTINYNSI